MALAFVKNGMGIERKVKAKRTYTKLLQQFREINICVYIRVKSFMKLLAINPRG